MPSEVTDSTDQDSPIELPRGIQTTLSRELGLTPQAVHNYANGHRRIKPRIAQRIASVVPAIPSEVWQAAGSYAVVLGDLCPVRCLLWEAARTIDPANIPPPPPENRKRVVGIFDAVLKRGSRPGFGENVNPHVKVLVDLLLGGGKVTPTTF